MKALLTSANPSAINNKAAVAATRGDLGQLAPRKKLLKSFSSFPEDFLRPSEHFGTEGFSFLPSLLPESNSMLKSCFYTGEALARHASDARVDSYKARALER